MVSIFPGHVRLSLVLVWLCACACVCVFACVCARMHNIQEGLTIDKFCNLSLPVAQLSGREGVDYRRVLLFGVCVCVCVRLCACPYSPKALSSLQKKSSLLTMFMCSHSKVGAER